MTSTTRHTVQRLATAAAASALALGSLSCLTPNADAASSAATLRPTDGWSAVVLAKGAARSGVLTLVSPTGAQYRITTVSPDAQVADISNDGRRVLVLHAGSRVHWSIVDVRTGRESKVAGSWSEARFTNPSGSALLARAEGRRGPGAVVRTDLAGRVQVRFAGTDGGGASLPSPDGTLLVSQNGRMRLQLNSNATGARLRSLAAPKGFGYCSPAHWVDSTHFTGACLATGRQDVQVFRFSTAGGAPVALTGRLPRTGALQFGYVDAWTTGKGSIVAAASSCGPARMGSVTSGRVSLFRVPAGAQPLSVVGSSTWFLNTAECDYQPTALARHDLASGRQIVLADKGRNAGLVVTSAAVLDRKQ